MNQYTDYNNDPLLERILRQSEETQKAVVALDKKIDLHIQKTEIELEHIGNLDEEQNRILDEHQKRCTEIEKDNILREQGLRADFEKRFQEVERPQIWIKTTLKYAIILGSMVSATLGIKQLWALYGTKIGAFFTGLF